MGTVVIRHVASDHPGVTIRLHGELDGDAGTQLQRLLVDLIRHRRPDRIVVDLRAAITVDALVVGTLQAAAELAREVQLTFAFEGSGSSLADRLIREELAPAA